MLNVNWEKIHSIILSVTCHGLRNFAPAHTYPLKTIHEFLRPYELLFSELESLIKCEFDCIKIYSIILCVTCHGLRNFAPLIHIPRYPFVNFQNPMSNYCLPSFEYKNNNYYFIIINVLYPQLYQKIITRCSLYKNLNGMITLVPREKSRRLPVFSMELKCFLQKQLQKKHAFSNIIQKAVDNNLSEENTEHLICDNQIIQ